MTLAIPNEAILSENDILYIFNEIKSRNNISLNIQDKTIKEWCIQMGIYVFSQQSNPTKELFFESVINEIQIEIENEIQKQTPISGIPKSGQVFDMKNNTISNKIKETQLKLQDQLKLHVPNIVENDIDINSNATELMEPKPFEPKHLVLIEEPNNFCDSILTSQCSEEI
jgi:hypothetical protein